MHNTAMVFIQTVLSHHPVEGKSVLEVGAYNVNGSVRDWVEKERPVSYVGVDLQPQARYVDETLSASDLIERFGRDAFDVVICAELLEHAEDWKATVRNLKGVLKVGGLLVLTCRGPGFPRHDFPGDYWRFTTNDMRRIFRTARSSRSFRTRNRAFCWPQERRASLRRIFQRWPFLPCAESLRATLAGDVGYWIPSFGRPRISGNSILPTSASGQRVCTRWRPSSLDTRSISICSVTFGIMARG